jgi:small multidrug resistance family-3 protein
VTILKSLFYFTLAGLCEIGGGYLIWLWLREGRNFWFALAGGITLICYGIVATQQPANFGRVYAAYGGFFIVMAVLWGWIVDRVVPDKYDLLGGWIALLGASVIMFAPRAK